MACFLITVGNNLEIIQLTFNEGFAMIQKRPLGRSTCIVDETIKLTSVNNQ